PVLDLEVERRLRRRERGLLFLAIWLRLVAGWLLPFDLIELRADLGEKCAPAIDRVVRILVRDAARLGKTLFVKCRVAVQIIELQFRWQSFGLRCAQHRER